MLVTEPAQRAGGEREQAPVLWRQSEPAGGEHAQHVAMTKGDRVGVGSANLGDHAVGARSDIGGDLPVGQPSRHRLQPGRRRWISAVVMPS